MGTLNFGETSILYLRQFSWVFMADWILAVLATIFLIFFVSRFFGFILSTIAKWVLWNQFRVFFEVGSIKFSLFSGNIMFKNLVYIGENEAFCILSGSLSWRFWLKRARQNSLEAPEGDHELPSRLHLSLKGVEWFVYNQSAAYEFAAAGATSPHATPTSSTTVHETRDSYSKFEQNLFRIMPITVQIATFAVIFGNPSTPTLLVGYSSHAKADIDVSAAGVAVDRYRMLYALEMTKPKMYFIANRDYDPKSRSPQQKSSMREILQRRKVRAGKAGKVAAPEPKFPSDTPEDHVQVSKLLSCDKLVVEYFYDVPDVCVKELADEPQMGYNLSLVNASVNYGPWAERRRVEFFELFFPQRCSDHPLVVPEVGKLRVIPQLLTNIKFEGPATFRLPVREFSKVEQRSLSKEMAIMPNTDAPYGWLELIAQDASISVLMDVVGRRHGFKMDVQLELGRPQLRTSVNHAELLQAEHLQVKLTHETHLKWNKEQLYTIGAVVASPQLFLLREHINLLFDLAADFNSGAAVPYDRFVPATYALDLQLQNFELLINVNPQNIISNPTSLDENVFLIFRAAEASYSVRVPVTAVAPVVSTVVGTLATSKFTMDVSSPSWHTLDAFLDERTVGVAHNFRLENSVTWYPEVDQTKVESNVLDLVASDFTLVCHGFVVDYLVEIINNYGGIDYQFQTFEEFLAKEHKEPECARQRNDLDTDIRILSRVERAAFVFPRYLYSARDNLCLCTEAWDADLRFTNYYMDLQTEFSPVRGYANYGVTDLFGLYRAGATDLSTPTLHCPELVVQAHRMFGLPPSEPTYVCKWDFNLDDISFHVDPQFLVLVGGIATAFGHGFSDKENKPQVDVYLPHDLTLVRATIGSINGQCVVDGTPISLQTSAIKFRFNDLSNARWDEKIWVDVPSIVLQSGESHFSTHVRASGFTQLPEQNTKQQDHIALHDSQFHRCAFFLGDERRKDPNYCSKPTLQPALALPGMPPQLTRETLLIVDPDMGDLTYQVQQDSASGSEASLYGSGEHESSSSSDDSDGSTLFKRRWGDDSQPARSVYLEPWGLPANPEKEVQGDPDVATRSIRSVPPRGDHQITSFIVDLGHTSCHLDVALLALLVGCRVEHTNEEAMDDLQAKIVEALGEKVAKELKFLVQCPLVKFSLSSGETLSGEASGLQAVGSILDLVEASVAVERVQVALGSLRVDLAHPVFILNRALELRMSTVDIGAAEFDALEGFLRDFRLPEVHDTRVKASWLLYSLISSGVSTEHDSYVLSRSPAGQAKNAIRGDISWRLVIRMRHLLAHTPRLELQQPPAGAKQDVAALLSGWRSWERAEPLEDAKIFEVFDSSSFPLPDLVFSIESFSLSLKHSETKEDYFVLDQLELSGNKENIVCTAQRARLGLSWQIIELVERLMARAGQAKSENTPGAKSSPPNEPPTTLPSILLNVRDWSAELSSPTLRCEFQNRDVQFMCSVHDSFASGSFGSSQSAIRIHAGKLEVLDYLMEKLTVGFCFNPSKAKNLLWLAVKVETLKLALNANFEEIICVVRALLETEVRDVRRLLESVAPGSSGPAGTTHVASSAPLQPFPGVPEVVPPAAAVPLLLHSSLSIASFVFQVKATNDLGFTFYGTNFASSARQPEPGSILVNIEWEKYELRAKTQASGTIGSYHVQGTRILARADLERKAFEVNYSVDTVILETTSVLTLLQYAQSAETLRDMRRISEAAQSTLEVLSDKKAPQGGTLSSETLPPDAAADAAASAVLDTAEATLLNLSGHISQVRISLPLDDFSVEFVFDNIDVSHRRFKWLSEGIQPEEMLTYGSFSELSSVLVHPTHSQKVFSVQLLASYKQTDVSSVYFTSDFCRVLLGPSALRSIFAAVDKVKSNLPAVAQAPFTPTGGAPTGAPTTKVDLLDFMKGFRAAIAFRDLSVSWEAETSGIRAGFELLQINLLQRQCRMDLVGFNVTPMDSPWHSLERNKYQNFAFLPHVEIIGVVLKDRFIDLVINGESLYVNLRPSIGLMIAAIIASVDEMGELSPASTHHPPPAGESTPHSPTNSPTATAIESLFSHSIRLRSKFSSAIFKLWDDNVEALEKVPSLELSSPNISFDTEYQRREGRDAVCVGINVSSSRNKIDPKALQELDALMANFSSHRQPTAPSAPGGVPRGSPGGSPVNSSFGEIKGEVISKFLRSFELVIDLSLASQELSASSQPFSKVAATISTESVRVLLTTPIEDDNTYIACSGTLKGARLLLQHAHSHDRTGFGEIDELNFTLSHNVKKDFYNHPFRAAAKVNLFEFEVKAPQMGDIKLFTDIWSLRRGEPLKPPSPSPSPEPSDQAAASPSSIGLKYKRLLDAYPMSWSVNLVLERVLARADLGSSLGKVEVEQKRFWVSLHRSSSFQSVFTGFDRAEIESVGRFAGKAAIHNASKRVSVYWEDSSKVPLMQMAFGIAHIEASLGLDGHQFIALSLDALKFCLSNQLTDLDASTHKLLSFVHFGDMSVALTSLVASNIFDVAESFNFIRTQSAIYEKTMLPTATTDKMVGSILSRLSVHIYAQISGIHLFVFPTSFEDTSALRVRSDEIGIEFGQGAEQNTESKLQISSSMLKVGLYTFKSHDGRPIFEHLKRTVSSNILFNIPQTRIYMQTTAYSERVEYVFRSMFGGDLEVGWNLGTVNFIKEMYETHKRTWLSRVATREIASKELKEAQEASDEPLPQLEKRPEYVPLQPPEIQIPNLHDMGVATPPVEWMGFNRERLPGMTHWFLIRALNEMVADIEKMYGRFLY